MIYTMSGRCTYIALPGYPFSVDNSGHGESGGGSSTVALINFFRFYSGAR